MNNNSADVVRSIRPTPDEEMTGVVIRLKHNPDFRKFTEVFIKGRTGVLAYLSCAPAFSEKQTHYIQGRVHELSDLTKMIEEIEDTQKNFEESKRAGGGGDV